VKKISKEKKSNTDKDLTTDVVDLKESLESLEQRIVQTNSNKRVFFKGVITGLGGAVGATIIFAIIISVASWFITTTDIPWIIRLIEILNLDKVADKF